MTTTDPQDAILLKKQAPLVYSLLGAAIGAVQGVATVSKHEAAKSREAAGKRLHEVLDQVHNTTEESAVLATRKAYEATGALSGIVAGIKYGFLLSFWTITDDDIKLRLLQASPVKYRLKELDFRGTAGNYAATAGNGTTATTPTATASLPEDPLNSTAEAAAVPKSIGSPQFEDTESYPSSSPESSADFAADRRSLLDQQDDSPRVLAGITNKV